MRPPDENWKWDEVLTNRVVWALALLILAACFLAWLTGCAGSDAAWAKPAGQPREQQRATTKVEATDHAEVETHEEQKQSSPTSAGAIASGEGKVETATKQGDSRSEVGDVRGTVQQTTNKFGLDPGTEALLARFAGIVEKTLGEAPGLLVKCIAAGYAFLAGLVVWALFAPAPANGRIELVAQIIGLAVMLAGPFVVFWLL